MRNIYMLAVAVLIAALIAGLNVAQVAHANTCVVNTDTTVANNVKNGNPHCFDPEQQPPTASTAGGTLIGTCGTAASYFNPCTQQTNPQGKIIGNPHEENTENGGSLNPQGNVVGSPHYPAR